MEVFEFITNILDNGINTFKSAKVESRPGSLSSFATKSIYYFPVLSTRNIDSENLITICRALEDNYASFVRSCFSLIPAMKVRGDVVNIDEYLRMFHQNIGIKGDDWSAFRFNESVELSRPYSLFKNGPLNEAGATTNNIRKIVKGAGLDPSDIVTDEIVKPIVDYGKKAVKDNVDAEYGVSGYLQAKKEIREDRARLKNNERRKEALDKYYAKHPNEKIGRADFDSKAGEIEKSERDMRPTVVKADCYFIIEGRGSGKNEKIKVTIPIGVKAVLHTLSSRDLTNHLIESISDRGTLHNFIRYTTGESLSLMDILFGINSMKSAIKGANSEIGRWIEPIEHRKRLNKMSKAALLSKPYLPNISVIISADDVREIEMMTGCNLYTDTRRAIKLMKDNYMLALVIADDVEETAKILYDGFSAYEEYPYKSMKRGEKKSNDISKELIKLLAR